MATSQAPSKGKCAHRRERECVFVCMRVFLCEKESLCVFNALSINLADVGIPVVLSHSLVFALVHFPKLPLPQVAAQC